MKTSRISLLLLATFASPLSAGLDPAEAINKMANLAASLPRITRILPSTAYYAATTDDKDVPAKIESLSTECPKRVLLTRWLHHGAAFTTLIAPYVQKLIGFDINPHSPQLIGDFMTSTVQDATDPKKASNFPLCAAFISTALLIQNPRAAGRGVALSLLSFGICKGVQRLGLYKQLAHSEEAKKYKFAAFALVGATKFASQTIANYAFRGLSTAAIGALVLLGQARH